jgi:hypothetical protein
MESFLALLGLGDDVVGHVFRAGRVVAELHGELAAAGGHGAEVADVAEHRGERGIGLDAHATGAPVILLLDHAAAAVEVADDVADVVASGVKTSSFMIGSRICGAALGMVWR